MRSDPTVSTKSSRSTRLHATLRWVAGIAVAIVLVGSGWFLATRFESPAQRAAAAAPPKARPITAQVTKGDLSDVTSVNATVGRSSDQDIPVNNFGNPSVVTRTPLTAGAQIYAGESIGEVNGRPTFALPGSFPLYRDLSSGDSGPDVREVQSGLVSAGFRVRVTGYFDSATTIAITTMYRHAGYSVATTTDESTDPSPTSSSSPSTIATATPPILLLPRAEVAIVNSLPAYVVSTPKLGTVLQDTDAIVVESGAAIATAEVDSEATTQLKAGLGVSLQRTGGPAIPATLANIGAPDKDGNVLLTFAPTGAKIPDDLLHQSLLATIVKQTVARNSLIVPSRAVVTSGGQSAHVLKLRSNGTFEIIKVTEIGALDGQSAITADTPGDLTTADFVKVG